MSTSTAQLDTEAVARFVSGRLPGFTEAVTAQKFAMGQSNPTYLLQAGDHRYVLRRKPLGTLLKSAHAVDREFRVLSALRGTAVPVPTVHLLCEDEDLIGSVFYIMDHVEGRTFGEPRLLELPRAARAATLDEMNRVLAELHMIDVDDVGLSDYGPPGNYFARQLARWSKQYHSSQTVRIDAMNALIRELEATLPEDDGQRTLVHGDFRIDNMIFSPDGRQCRALLDWELSTLGHPYADLAGVIMQWQMPPGSEGRGLAGVDRAAEGLVTDTAFVQAYCDRRGLTGIPDFGFYLAFSFFRMGAILQGVLKRALDGNASNPEQAQKLGSYVPHFARAGLDALEKPDL